MCGKLQICNLRTQYFCYSRICDLLTQIFADLKLSQIWNFLFIFLLTNT
jgi:hypothetical protein